MSFSLKKQNKIRMILKYRCKEDTKEIRIFGDKFVKNNQSHCKISINDKKLDLVSILKIKPGFIINNIITITLKKVEKIKDMSSMFQECTSLENIESITDIIKDKITNMSSMFYGCTSLKDCSELTKINIKNVTDIVYLIYQFGIHLK